MQSLWQYFRTFTVPSFATSGARIVLDGIAGTLSIYNASNTLTVQMGGTDGSITDFGTNVFAKLVNGSLLLGKLVGGIPDTTDAAFFQYLPGGVDYTLLQSHLIPAGGLNDAAQLLLFPGAAGVSPPGIFLRDALGTAPIEGGVFGALAYSDSGNNLETWHTPSAAAGYTVTTMQYRRDIEDNVIWVGEIVQTTGVAGAGAAIVIGAVPAAYRPLKTWSCPGSWLSTTSVAKGAVVVNVNTSGTLSVIWPSSTANGDKFSFNARIPLGNIL